MTVQQLVDKLETMIRDAKEVPLLGGAMLDREKVIDLIDRIILQAGQLEPLDDGRVVRRGAGVLDPIDDLMGAVTDAKDVPLTIDRARVDREALLAIMERVRAGAAEDMVMVPPEPSPPRPYDPGPLIALVDRLEGHLRAAKPVPLTDQVRLDREEIYDILDMMRAHVPETARTAPEWARDRLMELLVVIDKLDDTLHNAPPVPLTDQVRVERRKIDEMIQSMRAAFSQGTLATLTN